MNRHCRECKRLNPSEAVYCFYDGVPLAGASGRTDFRTWAFPNPFVFPSGQECANFLQLATACRRWPEQTLDILGQGFFEAFFSSLGRADLALVARNAARMTDRDRALDELLGSLPGSPLPPASLAIDPQEKDLGIVPLGEDRQFTLTLTNQGQRLVYGKVAVEDCPWLAMGDGAAEKVFQFFDKLAVPVTVVGKRLRARAQPQKAEITIESNGGNFILPIEVTVPVKPFAEGALAGVTSPRQLAEKAKASLREAAELLESGAVARWYEANGWPYPVQGPTASGIAAVQQFFETLGLVKPPRMDVSENVIALRGRPGERIEYVVVVMTQEKRAAFAHAASDQPWLKVEPTIFRKQMATIPLVIEAVPARPGESLTARLKVTANGNQRFDVPVTLQIAGTKTNPGPLQSMTPTAVPTATAFDAPVAAFAPEGAVGAAPEAIPLSPFAGLTAPSAPVAAFAPTSVPVAGGWWTLRWRLLPVVIVVLGLIAVVVRDAFFR